MKGIITLTTDFGTKDHYVGTMKGVICGINPDVTIIDITHEIAKYDIVEAAFKLYNFCSYFPEGAVHVIVVDPGVGGSRKPIAVESGGHCFVGPDNGVFSLIISRNGTARAFEIMDCKYMMENVSSTFHGRDIFAPAAAHISLGLSIKKLGRPVLSPVLLDLIEPEITSTEIKGSVIYEDSFGNLITNIPYDLLSQNSKVKVGQFSVERISNTYGDGREGELVVLKGSSGLLEISVNQGSASQLLNVKKPSVVVKLV